MTWGWTWKDILIIPTIASAIYLWMLVRVILIERREQKRRANETI